MDSPHRIWTERFKSPSGKAWISPREQEVCSRRHRRSPGSPRGHEGGCDSLLIYTSCILWAQKTAGDQKASSAAEGWQLECSDRLIPACCATGREIMPWTKDISTLGRCLFAVWFNWCSLFCLSQQWPRSLAPLIVQHSHTMCKYYTSERLFVFIVWICPFGSSVFLEYVWLTDTDKM